MKSNRMRTGTDSTKSRLVRLTTSAAATIATVATVLTLAPATAQAFVPTGPPVFPMPKPPTRIAYPTPTSSAYVAPIVVPTTDILRTAVNDPARDLTFTIKPASAALAGLDSTSIVGRIVVATPPGGTQSVDQVISATHAKTAWTVVTKRVSALAALAPGNYPIQANFAGASFTTPSGAKAAMAPAISNTYELGPYTVSYACGDGGSVNLTADLKLTPWIDADADIGWFSLNSAHLIAGLDEVATLSASTTGPDVTPATCAKTVTLGSFNIPIDIGPLVANVSFSLKADINASLLKTITTSVVQTFSGSAGVRYDGDNWTLVDNASETNTYTPPTVTGTDRVEVGLTAEVKLSFFDVISGRLDLRAYAGIAAAAPPSPAFSFYIGAKLTYEIDVAGWDIADGTIWTSGNNTLWHTPVVNTTTLPGAHWGMPSHLPNQPPSYTKQLSADGGFGSLTFSIIAGKLPDGMRLTSAGLLTGTPLAPVLVCDPPPCAGGTPDEDFTFTVQVTDGSTNGSRQLKLHVGTILIGAKLTDGYQGKLYKATLTSTGAVGGTSWALVGGALPTGLTLSAAGVISGTVSSTATAKVYSFMVQVKDSVGNSATATLSMRVNSSQ